jgi:hypothetical protein
MLSKSGEAPDPEQTWTLPKSALTRHEPHAKSSELGDATGMCAAGAELNLSCHVIRQYQNNEQRRRETVQAASL